MERNKLNSVAFGDALTAGTYKEMPQVANDSRTVLLVEVVAAASSSDLGDAKPVVLTVKGGNSPYKDGDKAINITAAGLYYMQLDSAKYKNISTDKFSVKYTTTSNAASVKAVLIEL